MEKQVKNRFILPNSANINWPFKKEFGMKAYIKMNLLRLLMLLFVWSFIGQVMASGYLPSSHYPNGFFISAGGVAGAMDVDGIAIKPTTGNTLNYNSFDDSTSGGIAMVGYKLSWIPLSFDAEYTIRSTISEQREKWITGAADENLKAKLQNHSVMLNALFDLPGFFHHHIVPYVMGGVGYSYNKADISATLWTDSTRTVKASKTKHNSAWQAGGGFHIKITNNVFVSLFYRYVDLGEAHGGPWKNNNSGGGYPARTLNSKDVTTNEGGITIDVFLGQQKQLFVPMYTN